MKLDPRGLEAAIAAVADSEGWNMDDMPITIQTATSAITAYLTAIGETHVLVPRMSTPKMDAAGVVYLRTHPSDASGCYETMLAAAKEGE
ncbi:MAG TPA: hypothetical protein VFL96_01490 [Acidobacteriaceae bacterium]|nr:hypothetical protein [Acidobacteriaceae bacterium]